MRLVTDADVAACARNCSSNSPTSSGSCSRFWLLFALSAVIAAAGVVSDSTATVIGAMIVAPLMTPILGTVVVVVLADRPTCCAAWAWCWPERPR